MPTQASQTALNGLWDLTMIKWYIIPLLAIIIYIYVTEMKKAQRNGELERHLRRPYRFRHGFLQ